MDAFTRTSEQLRRLWWNDTQPARDMLQKALKKLDAQLEAKETKFFSCNGVVVETREVPDNALQQSAAIAIARMADAFPRDRSEKVAAPRFKVTIVNGVFSLTMGDSESSQNDPPREEAAYALNANNGNDAPGEVVQAELPLFNSPIDPVEVEPVQSMPTVRVPLRNRREALRILMNETDETEGDNGSIR